MPLFLILSKKCTIFAFKIACAVGNGMYYGCDRDILAEQAVCGDVLIAALQAG